MSEDIECEISYMLVRHWKPETVVEMSPNCGWSTSWLLHALKDNKFGVLHSYDMIDEAQKRLPKGITENRWVFPLGDIVKNISSIPSKIDYLYMDSDHYEVFANWYIENIVGICDYFHGNQTNPMVWFIKK